MFSQIQFMEKISQINIIDLDKEIRPAKRTGQFLENTKNNWSNFVKWVHIYPVLSATGRFCSDLQKYRPINPVIKKTKIHLDVTNAILNLNEEEKIDPVIEQAYI